MGLDIMKDYIIIANGDFLIKEIIVEAIQGKIIVALDGAANKLARLGIKPDYILGDFDSTQETEEDWWGIGKTFDDITESSEQYLGKYGVSIIPAKNQDYTDLVKAIHFCDSLLPYSITLLCATGSRLDHHEGVMRALRTEYKKERPIWLHTAQQTLLFAKEQEVIINGEVDDKCGILAFPSGAFSSKGLKYEVRDYKLDFGFSESICNSLTTKNAQIQVTGEVLIIMPGQLSSQREWIKTNEIGRLEKQLRDAKQKVFEITVDDALRWEEQKNELLCYSTESRDTLFSGDRTRKALISVNSEQMVLLKEFTKHQCPSVVSSMIKLGFFAAAAGMIAYYSQRERPLELSEFMMDPLNRSS